MFGEYGNSKCLDTSVASMKTEPSLSAYNIIIMLCVFKLFWMLTIRTYKKFLFDKGG